MAAYKKFARIYDAFMRDIPYGRWARYAIDRLRRYGVRAEDDCLLLELGCGTGSMARYFCMEGYEVVGIDLSESMVREASAKFIPGFEAYNADMRIPFLENESCDAVVSFCDSMNYLTSLSDLSLAMRAAAMQLKQGGIFMFDMKTDSFYRNELGDNVFADRVGRDSYIWENHYDTKRHINVYDITFYHRVFGRICTSFTERHVQRAYPRRLVVKTAAEYGLSLKEYRVRGERAYYIFKKVN